MRVRILPLIGLFVATTGFANNQLLAPPDADITPEKIESWQETFQRRQAQIVHAQPNTGESVTPVFINGLVASNSPYLLQHATNPINWKSWGEAGIGGGVSNDRLILLSIGYSSCHWCHVMEAESFQDVEVAKLLNKYFVAVKVDREQHPEIDQYYSAALEVMTGSAGWPITAVLLPSGAPVVVTSYLSKQDLVRLLDRSRSMYGSNPAAMVRTASRIEGLIEAGAAAPDLADWDPTAFLRLEKTLLESSDPFHGGINGAPKFPHASRMIYLLDRTTRATTSAAAVQLQLTNMMTRGLYDHVHGGFHRYTVDDQWRLPHFEKMLYSQGLHMLVYTRAYEITGDLRYLEVCGEIVTFLEEWLADPGGGYYAAVDADYRGLEGGFYLHSREELDAALAAQADVGNLVFYPLDNDPAGLMLVNRHASTWSLSAQQRHQITECLRALRATVPRPFIDHKVLLGWNSLVLWGMAEYTAFAQSDRALDTVRALGDYLWSNHFNTERRTLYRTRYDGQVGGEVSFGDVAYSTRALLAVYDLTHDAVWLERAVVLGNLMYTQFIEITGDSSVAGNVEFSHDTELPSARAVALENLHMLWERTGERSFRERRDRMLPEARSRFVTRGMNHLYAGAVLSMIELGETNRMQYFARGHGRVEFDLARDSSRKHELTLAIELSDGWHINSAHPLQDYLKPTRLTLENDGAANLEIEYPKPSLISVSFEDSPLSLYESKFAIRALVEPTDENQPLRFKVQFQACDDRVCLPPEVLSFSVTQ